MERGRKIVLATEALLLLLPLTLLTALLVYASYPAYPLTEYRLLQAAFDVGMVVQVAAIGSAWRLAAPRLRSGLPGLRRAPRAWFAPLAAGAVLGLAGGIVAVEHALNPEAARSFVGFALFAPAAVLVPLWLHLAWERRRAVRTPE